MTDPMPNSNPHKAASQAPAVLDYRQPEAAPVDETDDWHLQAARRAWERNARIAPGQIGQHFYRVLSIITLIIVTICIYAVGVVLWRMFI